MSSGVFVGFKILMFEGVKVSLVMICNDMKVLEDEGLLLKIYFFFGWILFVLGYCYYVDYLLKFVCVVEDDLLLIC